LQSFSPETLFYIQCFVSKRGQHLTATDQRLENKRNTVKRHWICQFSQSTKH